MSCLPLAPRVVLAAAAHTDSSVDPIDIPKLAKMAQIQVTEQEVADWEPKIAGIVDWFGQLQAVDVSGVPPAVHARDEGNVLRPDEPATYGNRAAIMQQVPEQQGGFVRVPKISTGADSAAASSAAGSAGSSMDAGAGRMATTPQVSDEVLAAVEDSLKELTNMSLAESYALDMKQGIRVLTEEEVAALAAVPEPLCEEEVAALQALDVRVGCIISCEPHPDADSLYVEKIDVGEAEPRTIVSGLRKYVSLEAMLGRPVVVLCNLKPRNMRGIKSNGMLLAASNEEHTEVEPLWPPSSAPGTRVWFGDKAEQAKPMEPNPLQKKKVWEGVQPLLRTDGAHVANFKGNVMQTAEGPVTASTLAGARIG